MSSIDIDEKFNQQRRRFLGTAALSIAAAQFGMIGAAAAQSSKAKLARVPAIKPGAHTSFGPLKQINAAVLNVGYAEAGPANGPAVILLHGWPYDIYSYVDVAPLLASSGYRVIVPYLRGYGTTRFLSNETFRNGEQGAVAVDIIALMDALKIEKATLAGFDWGARTADIIAALWPERCKALVSVSGYLIGSQEAGNARCRQRPSSNGGINTILPPSTAEPATTSTGTTSQSSFGSSLRPNGTSMMPRSSAVPRPSTTLITSIS
jgi:pimeloyl-ACP methyl ester carboxylesterase